MLLRVWSRFACVGLYLSLLSFTTFGLLVANPSPQNLTSKPLPLDPLSGKEWLAAKQLVLTSSEVRGLFPPNAELRISSVDLLQDKSSGQSSTLVQRRARVILYNPVTNVGVAVVANITKAKIEAVEKLDSDEIPLAFGDLQEARRLALDDESFRHQVLGKIRPADYIIEGMLVRTLDEADPCKRDRCVNLLVRHGDRYVIGVTVTVDLTKSTVTITKE